MPTRFTMTIGGNDVVCRLGTLRISETLNGRNTLTCQLLSLDASTRYDIGDEILVTDADDGGARIFGGNVSSPSEHAIDDQLIEEFAISISAVDFNAIADRQTVIGGGIPAGFTLKQAITSLAGYLAPYGVTVDPAQADGPTLPLMQYDVKRVSSWFDELSVITGFVWEIDYNKVLRFIETGTLGAPFHIADDDGHTVGDIIVEPTDVDYANRVIVLAGEGQREVTEALTFNGSDDFIDLTYTLVGHRGYLTVNGSNETLGGSPAMWVFDTVVPNRIKREAGVPAAGVGEIIYTAQFPYLAQADDLVEQGGPRGIVDTVFTKTDVFEATLAEALADGYLLRTVTEPRTIRYSSFEPGLHPGQAHAITSSVRDLSTIVLITEVQATDIDGETMRYDVTAVEGDIYTGSWRDMYRQWSTGGGGSSSSASTGAITVISSGGVGGSGTPGSLAQWDTPATLGDATAVPASLLTGTIPNAVQDNITRLGTIVSGTVPWARLTFSGSSLADLATRSAGDLTSGNLAYARMPTGSGSWSATPTITGAVTLNDTLTVSSTAYFGGDLLPTWGYTSDIGSLTLKFAGLYAAELFVETLVAQDVMATIGGRVIVAPTTVLIDDLTSAQTTIKVKHNQIASGDFLFFEANGQIEWMKSTSGPTTITGGYSYTVERNKEADPGGPEDWPSGSSLMNTGTTGDGFIDLYSVSGVLSGSGPTIVGNVRTGTTYNNVAPRWAIGNLNGLYSYVTDTYGAAFGDPSNAWLKIDATNGIRIGHNTTTKIELSATGNASFASGGVTVNQNGISTTPTTSAAWADPNAYRFTVSNGELGMLGFDDSSGTKPRGLSLVSKWTGTGDYTPTITQTAQNAPVSGGTAWAVSATTGWLTVENTYGFKVNGGALHVFAGDSGSTFRITTADFTILSAPAGSTRFKVTNSTGATEWGGGSAISSSSNVALLNASNTFSAANPIVLGSSANGTIRADSAGYLSMQSGSSGFAWVNNANNATRMILSDAGVLTLVAYTGTTFVAGDKYLVIDASGVIHVSALGPAS